MEMVSVNSSTQTEMITQKLPASQILRLTEHNLKKRSRAVKFSVLLKGTGKEYQNKKNNARQTKTKTQTTHL